MGVLVVSSSFSVVFEDEQVDSPISSSFSPEFEDERITGRGVLFAWIWRIYKNNCYLCG